MMGREVHQGFTVTARDVQLFGPSCSELAMENWGARRKCHREGYAMYGGSALENGHC